MNRLSDDDKRFGPITIGTWSKSFSAWVESGYDDDSGGTRFLLTGFGRALRVALPIAILKPSGKYGENQTRYGVSLSDMGNGYDFFQAYFGAQTWNSSTEKSWCCHFPWRQWSCVRHSLYAPGGDHFYTQPGRGDFLDFLDHREKCPKAVFEFEDFDGEKITATCCEEEREWRRGNGWFKWLRVFYTPKVRRSLGLSFSSEVGPEKGSWKGGVTGHGIDMLPGESCEGAFQRYCEMEHKHKGRSYRLKFVGKREVEA